MKTTTFTAISEELHDRITTHPDITLGQKLIAFHLLRLYNRRTHTICVSMRTVATHLKCSVNTVMTAINRLEGIGFLTRITHRKKGKCGGDFNHYQLPLEGTPHSKEELNKVRKLLKKIT